METKSHIQRWILTTGKNITIFLIAACIVMNVYFPEERKKPKGRGYQEMNISPFPFKETRDVKTPLFPTGTEEPIIEIDEGVDIRKLDYTDKEQRHLILSFHGLPIDTLDSLKEGKDFSFNRFGFLTFYKEGNPFVIHWVDSDEYTYHPLVDTVMRRVEKVIVNSRKTTELVQKLGSKAQIRYVNRFAKTAREEMRKYGIPASISLAQGILESGSGTSKLAKAANNHFGIKCTANRRYVKKKSKTRCAPGHCYPLHDDNEWDRFIIFKSAWGSWRNHSHVLMRSRYKELHSYGTDYRKWANGLQDKGYATSPTYGRDLIRLIEKLQLYKYDVI